MDDTPPGPRRILVAELLAIGTELTVGETTDTNSGELARSLVAHGVTVARTSSLPDDLGVVVDALTAALARADLVVTTGGLGPTPDDLTREAVAATCGEAVAEDPATLARPEELWARRGMPFPSVNRKQAWLIPSATGLPNPHGTAPGWKAIEIVGASRMSTSSTRSSHSASRVREKIAIATSEITRYSHAMRPAV